MASTSQDCPICANTSRADERFQPHPLRRCQACGFAFFDAPQAAELYEDSYFEDYLGGDYLAQEHQRRYEARVRLRLLEELRPPGGRLLEVGSAAGFFLDEARRLGYEPLGIEPNERMVEYARDKLGVSTLVGELADVKLEPGAFEIVCAFHVIEHLGEPSASMRKLYDALRPGGYLVVEVPNAESAAARRRGAKWRPLELPYHLGHYGPRSLATLMGRTGFEVMRIDTVPFAHYARGRRLMILAHAAAEGIRARGFASIKPHPSTHQLLRGAARRPVHEQQSGAG